MKVSTLLEEIRLGLARHKLRSALVLLTFALGFASVLITIGTVEGGRRSILASLDALGPDLIAVMHRRSGLFSLLSGRRPDDERRRQMEELSRELGRDARRIIPMEVGLGQVLADADSEDADPLTTTVVAAPPELFQMIRVGMLAGRAYTTDGKTFGGEDMIEVVLDEALARDIRPADPGALVGTEVEARRPGYVFQARVVGVLRDPIALRKHMKVFDTSSSARIVTGRRLEFKNLYVPYVQGRDAVSLLLIQVTDLEGLSPGEERIRDFFSASDEEPFIFAQKAWIDAIGVYVNRFSFLAHFFWILNLGVVLVLSSTIAGLAIEERFRELAIRRVEGATLGQVLLPILGEGVVLAGLALPAGWALSEWILADYVVPTLGWPPVVPGHFWIWLPLLLLGVGLATYGIPGRHVARRAPVSVLARHG